MSDRGQKIGAVARVTAGNFLEQYDFFVFGYYATYIGKTFFPATSDFASLVFAFATFGVAFLMRPLGALVLGAYIDRRGRRAGLILTLGLMAIGTLTIAGVPGYATIGALAPILVVLGRLLQGFSAGAEFGGVSIYLAEIATPGNRGFYCSWQSCSQQLAVIFASLIGFVLSQQVPPDQMTVWGWRVPMLIGCLIIPLIFLLRRSLEETAVFAAQKEHPKVREIARLLLENWPVVLTGALLSTLTTTAFYLITAYTPTYGKEVLRFALADTLLVTCLVGVSNLVWLPIAGALSDRVGRRPMLLGVSGLAIVTAYPAMAWLTSAATYPKLISVELWFSLIYSFYNGAMIPFLAEIMPFKVRTTGFSFAFSMATAIFGGFTPFVSTLLIGTTGNKASPALWLMAAAALAFGAALYSRRYLADVRQNDERVIGATSLP